MIPPQAGQPWSLTRVYGKVTEAKCLTNRNGKRLIDGDLFCVCRINNISENEYQTSIVTSEFSVWAEDFIFETQTGYQNIKIVLWHSEKQKPIRQGSQLSLGSRSMGDLTSGAPIPLGKVVLSRSSIKNDQEEWLLIKDASLETKVMGSVQIKIEHSPPNIKRDVHGFSVSIVRAKDLSNDDGINPFAVLHFFPDTEGISTEITSSKKKTSDPQFSEVFFFTCSDTTKPAERHIHVAIWDQTGEHSAPSFLGHVIIPLSSTIQKQSTNRWYTLDTLPDDSLLARTRGKMKEDEIKNIPRDFAMKIQQAPASNSKKDHKLVEKSSVLATCSQCNTSLIGVHLTCEDCQMSCHQKCEKLLGSTCGGLGAVRVTFSNVRLIILPLSDYQEMIQALKEDNFSVLLAVNKAMSNSDDLSSRLLRVLNRDYFEYVMVCLRNEILQSDNPKTLFRGNTSASKSLSTYMRHLGLDYLKETLENVLISVLNTKKPFEVDSIKIEEMLRKDKKKGIEPQSPHRNAENLRHYLELIIGAIFASPSKMPPRLRRIFGVIQAAAVEKFVGIDSVGYTAVSAFLFLRFLNPAILSPSQFGLQVGFLDTVGTRKLLLIGKTLLNLANLIEFKEKESFMIPLNTFITDRIPHVKKFIDAVCLKDDKGVVNSPENHLEHLVALDCADVHLIVSARKEKIKESNPIMFQELCSVLGRIESKIGLISSNRLPFLNEIGTDVFEEEEAHAYIPEKVRVSQEEVFTATLNNQSAPTTKRYASVPILVNPVSPKLKGSIQGLNDVKPLSAKKLEDIETNLALQEIISDIQRDILRLDRKIMSNVKEISEKSDYVGECAVRNILDTESRLTAALRLRDTELQDLKHRISMLPKSENPFDTFKLDIKHLQESNARIEVEMQRWISNCNLLQKQIELVKNAAKVEPRDEEDLTLLIRSEISKNNNEQAGVFNQDLFRKVSDLKSEIKAIKEAAEWDKTMRSELDASLIRKTDLLGNSLDEKMKDIKQSFDQTDSNRKQEEVPSLRHLIESNRSEFEQQIRRSETAVGAKILELKEKCLLEKKNNTELTRHINILQADVLKLADCGENASTKYERIHHESVLLKGEIANNKKLNEMEVGKVRQELNGINNIGEDHNLKADIVAGRKGQDLEIDKLRVQLYSLTESDEKFKSNCLRVFAKMQGETAALSGELELSKKVHEQDIIELRASFEKETDKRLKKQAKAITSNFESLIEGLQLKMEKRIIEVISQELQNPKLKNLENEVASLKETVLWNQEKTSEQMIFNMEITKKNRIACEMANTSDSIKSAANHEVAAELATLKKEMQRSRDTQYAAKALDLFGSKKSNTTYKDKDELESQLKLKDLQSVALSERLKQETNDLERMKGKLTESAYTVEKLKQELKRSQDHLNSKDLIDSSHSSSPRSPPRTFVLSNGIKSKLADFDTHFKVLQSKVKNRPE